MSLIEQDSSFHDNDPFAIRRTREMCDQFTGWTSETVEGEQNAKHGDKLDHSMDLGRKKLAQIHPETD